MKSSQQLTTQERIKIIFQKQYEYRNQFQHKHSISFLQPYFPTLSKNTIKMLTFFIQVIEGSKKDDVFAQRILQHGILITISTNQWKEKNGIRNPETTNEYRVVKNEKVNFVNKNSFGLYITYENYLSCLNLGQTTIEDQLTFFHSSQYLCSMPRKKYFTILRNSKVLSFAYRQAIYSQSQMIISGQSGSGVYLLRHGQMAYVKKIKEQNVEVYRFGPGHLIGTLESQVDHQKRIFSVKCKSGHVVVYQISQQFFSSFVKPYCQSILMKKQKKLEKFLSQQSSKLSIFRQKHEQFNANLRRSQSCVNENQHEKKFKNTSTVRMFTSRDLPTLIKTERYNSSDIQKDQLRKTSYIDLRYNGPLKNYPKVVQKSIFFQSQFKDLDKLKEKNQKISKIRNIKNIQSQQSRQSILFKLFENSWKFQKLKKKKNF